MKKSQRMVIILIIFFILVASLILIIKQFNKSTEKDYCDNCIKLSVGESYKEGYITLKEVKPNSVIIHIYKNSVECGLMDKDFEITKEGIKIAGIDIFLESVSIDSATLKLILTPTFC